MEYFIIKVTVSPFAQNWGFPRQRKTSGHVSTVQLKKFCMQKNPTKHKSRVANEYSMTTLRTNPVEFHKFVVTVFLKNTISFFCIFYW